MYRIILTKIGAGLLTTLGVSIVIFLGTNALPGDAAQIRLGQAATEDSLKALREEFLDYIKKAIPVAKRVNAKWMTVVPGYVDLRQNMAYQTAHVVESLKQASALLEPHGIVMVLEPLNFRDHPGLFFIGEAVDVTGWLGGYNFQWAWSSGWVAAQHV